jgi:mRNA interferase MazF
MRRGQVWLVNLEPVRGSEAAKTRPCVVVSNDGGNAAAVRTGEGVVTVAPLTSNVARVWPFQVFVPAATSPLERDSKVQAEQVRAVSPDRMVRRLGTMSSGTMREVDDALRLHLSLG